MARVKSPAVLRAGLSRGVAWLLDGETEASDHPVQARLEPGLDFYPLLCLPAALLRLWQVRAGGWFCHRPHPRELLA